MPKQPKATAMSAKLTAFCPRKVIGRPVISSCSLPNAMNEPVTVSAPNSTSKPSAPATPWESPGVSPVTSFGV